FLYSLITVIFTTLTYHYTLSYLRIPSPLHLIIIVLMILSVPTFFVIKPYYTIASRRSRIDSNLHHTCAFLYAVTKAGIQPLEAFQHLVERKHIYGAIAEEFGIAVRRVKYLGENLYTSLHYVASTTSSKRLREFIEGFIVKTKQSLTIEAYFQKKFREFFELEKVSKEATVRMFGLLGELTIVLIALTPSLMLTIGLSLGIVNPNAIHWSNIYMVIATPILASILLILIRIFCPLGEAVSTIKFTLQSPAIENIPLKVGEGMNERSFVKRDRLFLLKYAFKRPLLLFFIYPWIILLIASLILTSVITLLYISNYNPYALLTYAIVGACMIGAIFHEVRFRYVMSIEKRTPDFLRGLAESIKGGGSIINAIDAVLESGLGLLGKEIKDIKMARFGLSLKQSLLIIEYRTASLILKKVLSLLAKALESTKNLRDILLMVAEDVESYIKLRRERALSMLGYVISSYICLGVYFYIYSTLKNQFITTLTSIRGFTINDAIRWVLIEGYYVALFLSITLGLIAGVMLEGSILSGLKHSSMMSLILIIWLGANP
ncbi:MAG: type II secretion system F family protein, partial [Nitrososphaerales archaeon]|nr:type II secretion system F family protein [Nitrososphaerales archaeon]